MFFCKRNAACADKRIRNSNEDNPPTRRIFLVIVLCFSFFREAFEENFLFEEEETEINESYNYLPSRGSPDRCH